tara:strand:- start:300 stop:515 length:216 start_codon:yes stop_codon:yes gene_type:complete
MTPQEEAKELVDKMWNIDERYGSIGFHEAKQCAMIAVNQIIGAIDFDWMEVQNLESEHRYWEQVKEEIQQL